MCLIDICLWGKTQPHLRLSIIDPVFRRLTKCSRWVTITFPRCSNCSSLFMQIFKDMRISLFAQSETGKVKHYLEMMDIVWNVSWYVGRLGPPILFTVVTTSWLSFLFFLELTFTNNFICDVPKTAKTFIQAGASGRKPARPLERLILQIKYIIRKRTRGT